LAASTIGSTKSDLAIFLPVCANIGAAESKLNAKKRRKIYRINLVLKLKKG
jgi:hypothetical protein